MPGDRRRPVAGPGPGTAAGFATAFVALGFVGRMTTVEGTSLALVWPAGGLAVLWFLVRGARPVSLDTLLLAVLSFDVNRVTGAPLDVSLLLTVTNVGQTLLAVTLLRRTCPELWGCGGDRALATPGLLARFLASATLATGLAALVGSSVGGLMQDGYDGTGALLWWGRNLCGVMTVTTLGLLLGQRLAVRSRGPRATRDGATRDRAGRVELAAAALLTVGAYALVFAFGELPVAFVLLVATVWFGLRFPTWVGAAHSVLAGAAAVALTLAGIGPFADVHPAGLGALVVQSFVLMTALTGLVLATGRDERQALEEELRRTQAEAVYEARLRDGIIGSVSEALLVVDDAGEILVRNAAAHDLLEGAGLASDPSSLLGAPVTYLDGTPVRDEERPSARALRGETVPVMEMRIDPPGGRARVLAVSATPLPPGADTGRARALLLCRDVTAEHAHREELRAFAGVVAHDLRNPLSAIDGWSEVLDDGLASGDLPTESARELLARVRSVSRRMHELIGDLLAHATSASLEIHPQRVDLVALVAQVVAGRQAEPHVTWGRIPPVEADPVLVRQVLDNLVGNALKYVAPGAAPRVTVSGRTDGTGFVVLRIADQGIGLPAGEHGRIFEEFHRAHTGGYEGTGLGLSICRRIVTRHGGTIVARDNPAGRGTVFELTLPAADAAVVRRGQRVEREGEDAGAGQVA